MGSIRNSAAEISHSLSRTQSMLSKITAPFSPKTRNLAEYYIRTKEPHRQYSPGDRVEGSVVVTVTKPIRISHLVVCLHGFVKVFNSNRAPGQSGFHDRGLLNGGSGKRVSEYFGDGFASLFENETALCGEGRLEVGSFEFQFDLELPSKGLPSSLNFERGTISYMITSTMTRPTTISPTSTCCCQINLVEVIDIAPFPRPKPRTVSVETLPKRSVAKIGSRKATRLSTAEKSPNPSVGTEISANRSDSVMPQTSNPPPKSPVPSEISSASAATSNASSHRISSAHKPENCSKGSDCGNSTDSFQDQVVTTIELMQGGCLPGDKLPLQISVNHNKPVKRLQGIIITMYREGHVDTHPAIPLGPSRPGKKKQYEDYYPKSRTGLGGLSLSSAGLSCSFRKDLSQKVVPLILDPRSLSAVIKTSIQVPEDLFPTINSVPGDMITFKYYIETVIDLRGKFAGQDRLFPRLIMTSGDSKYNYNDYTVNKLYGLDGITLPSTAPAILLNTENIRREKGVVSCLFHVVVGTRDSERKRTRQMEKQQVLDTAACEASRKSNDNRIAESTNGTHNLEQANDTTLGPGYQNGSRNFENYNHLAHNRGDVVPQGIPPPDIEEDLDEKSRIRRAEQRLLPSAPETNEQFSSRLPYLHPSAPEAFEDEEYIRLYGHARPNAPTSDELPASSLETVILHNGIHSHQDGPHASDSLISTAGPQEDKQELERRRLQMSASSPDDHQDNNMTGFTNQPRDTIEPTAPFLNEEYQPHYHDPNESHPTSQKSQMEPGNENLPLYEK